MRFSENWLREWVRPGLDTDGLARQLTMAGLEVDAVEPTAAPLTGVVVGRIEACEPHPDADRLRVCTVDAGQGDALRIVCGAPNARAGLAVAVALTGTTLPGGTKIRRAKLRGVESDGMICSSAELGLGESSDGILELDPEAPVGRPLVEYLELGDSEIAIDLTPNRGDCLGIAGIAREVGAVTDTPVTAPEISPVPAGGARRLEVSLADESACPHYAGRVIEGIDPAARTPDWLRERLRRSGLRSLSPVVDVTNYVMLELGQPMHAFDLERLEGGITVRTARAGEALELLNGDRVEPEPDTLVIADESGPVALAGIMGGVDTAVSLATVDVFLESALFTPEAISGRARRHGLHTDSSHRFERGVDPTIQVRAIERATRLLLGIVGGRPGPVVAAGREADAFRAPVPLRGERLNLVLGTDLALNEARAILERLGMCCRSGDGALTVKPPAHRYDVAIEADLIEEVARVYGYDRLPGRRPRAGLSVVPRSESRVSLQQLRRVLVDRGYREAITYSFVDASVQSLLDPGARALDLANPISREMSRMRTSLWPGLIGALRHNLHRQQTRVRLFEIGQRFLVTGTGLAQTAMLGGIASGPVWPEQWAATSRPVDFFDVKGDVEALLAPSLQRRALVCRAGRHGALHPGQTARLVLEEGRSERILGWLGVLHPRLVRELDLAATPVLFELEMEPLGAGQLPQFRPPSRYPAVRRDIAVVVDELVPAAEVARVIREVVPELLAEVVVFDVYRGAGIDSGRKSIALGLIFQHSSRTLEDPEVDALIDRVLDGLSDDLNAKIRE
ncbi:MAG TPA: phenylalanine--tRNA ligase subunit beta [Gammaproteobacteria bacterium]|nr:phenylalanine--tRNA ligase subunit beta [Gammaproteobacteria bacterium]